MVSMSAAVTMKNKPNDTFKRAVGAWSALSKVEKETYKVERMALMAQEKAAEELAAEAAKGDKFGWHGLVIVGDCSC